MPSDNSSVNGCGVYRRMKGIGIFQIPAENNNKEWREKWLAELLKIRKLDTNFRRQINENSVFICERHFNDSDIEICKYRTISFT